MDRSVDGTRRLRLDQRLAILRERSRLDELVREARLVVGTSLVLQVRLRSQGLDLVRLVEQGSLSGRNGLLNIGDVPGGDSLLGLLEEADLSIAVLDAVKVVQVIDLDDDQDGHDRADTAAVLLVILSLLVLGMS